MGDDSSSPLSVRQEVVMRELFSLICPSCHEENLIDNGDVSDLTGCDVEDFKCCKCGRAFKITDEGEAGEELLGEDAVHVTVAEAVSRPQLLDYDELVLRFRRYFTMHYADRLDVRKWVNVIVNQATSNNDKKRATDNLKELLEKDHTDEAVDTGLPLSQVTNER